MLKKDKAIPHNKKTLIHHLSQLTDPRSKRGVSNDFYDILLIVIMATMSGYFGERAKGDFVKRNEDALIKILKPKHKKLPSYQTIDRVVDKLNFDELSLVFIKWANSLDQIEVKDELKANKLKDLNLNDNWIHLDGKAIKGSLTNYNSKQQRFINLVSAFCSKRKQALGFNLVENDKESEIPKVRELIKLLNLEEAVFTADALHCQKETARTIIESNNDYVLQVKGNQKKLKQQVKKTVK